MTDFSSDAIPLIGWLMAMGLSLAVIAVCYLPVFIYQKLKELT